jgi:hypothetical protein
VEALKASGHRYVPAERLCSNSVLRQSDERSLRTDLAFVRYGGGGVDGGLCTFVFLSSARD